MLYSLLLLPPIVVLYIRIQRRRQLVVASYGSLGLVRETARRRLGWRRHIPPALFLLALTLLLLPLARPKAVVNLPRIEGTVILAFDVSGSMAADDLEPTRMEAAKAAARAFVTEQPPNVLIGVVAFSDSGFGVQQPTNDQEAILATINRLTPQLGTSLANGIFASLNTLTAEEKPDPRRYTDLAPEPTRTPTPVLDGTYRPSVIVLLTDGENNVNPDPFTAVMAASERGVRVHTVGIGRPAGTTLETDGFVVHTQLDEAMLQKISELTGGMYYSAETAADLQAIYENLDTQLVIKPEKMEVTSIFAGASMLVLLIGGTFSLLWFNRVP
jgi:Ca-activated chloride channel family protein